MKMTHTNRALAKLNYSFHCSYAARHILFSAPPPPPVPSPQQTSSCTPGAQRCRGAVTAAGGRGRPCPALPSPAAPLCARTPPSRHKPASRPPHPRLTLPSRGGARRGAQSPHCGRRRNRQPPPRRSSAPGRRAAARYSPLRSLRSGWPLTAPGGGRTRRAGRGHSSGGQLGAEEKGAAGANVTASEAGKPRPPHPHTHTGPAAGRPGSERAFLTAR